MKNHNFGKQALRKKAKSELPPLDQWVVGWTVGKKGLARNLKNYKYTELFGGKGWIDEYGKMDAEPTNWAYIPGGLSEG